MTSYSVMKPTSGRSRLDLPIRQKPGIRAVARRPCPHGTAAAIAEQETPYQVPRGGPFHRHSGTRPMASSRCSPPKPPNERRPAINRQRSPRVEVVVNPERRPEITFRQTAKVNAAAARNCGNSSRRPHHQGTTSRYLLIMSWPSRVPGAGNSTAPKAVQQASFTWNSCSSATRP